MKSLACFACVALLFCGVSAKAEPKPEYLASFDPAKGFKPAQRDLTEVFLQIAGSLEANGSPEFEEIFNEYSRFVCRAAFAMTGRHENAEET